MSVRQLALWSVAWTLLSAASVPAAERFALEVPGDVKLSSSATLDGDALTIVDSSRQTYDYRREPAHDTADGKFLGFYCRRADLYVRWPAAGAGAMYLGEPRGRQVNWRESRMRIRSLDAPAGGAANIGGALPGRPQPGVAQPVAAALPKGPMHLAALRRGADAYTVAQIDAAGKLQFYDREGQDEEWKGREAELAQQLVPGGPMALVDVGIGQPPKVYTVSPSGELVEVTDGRQARVVGQAGAALWRVGTNLVAIKPDPGARLAAVDTQGRLVQIEPISGRVEPIDAQPGRYAPGVSLAVGNPARQEVVLIDKAGTVNRYSQQLDGWRGPEPVAGGFQPSGHVAAGVVATGDVPVTYIAAVDATGQPRLLRSGANTWSSEPLTGVKLPPGAPLALGERGDGVVVSGVTSSGDWTEWARRGPTWSSTIIAPGFAPGAPVWVDPAIAAAFGVDRTGRLIAGQFVGGGWRSRLLMPRFARMPLMTRRQVIPNPALPPAQVSLDNSHAEELVVRVFDVRRPDKTVEHRIPPGGSVAHAFDRDAGAVLEEAWLVPGPLGALVEQVRQTPVPPQRYYDIVVYEHKVTYRYVDPKRISGVQDFDLKTNVSLGVYPVPPGDMLPAAERLDIYRAAVSMRNPGAAAGFGPP